tara:strand:- start:121 stop:456 length:336 start_codon:yes stop_codon:yes gene_type:complete
MNNKNQQPKIPSGLHSYEKEAIKMIDHLIIMLPAIRERLLSGIEQMNVGVKATSFDEVNTSSSLPADPVGEIVVDPRRSKRRNHIKRTREAIKRVHKFSMDALDAATDAAQ